MPKNADLKARVRKIMARDGLTYQVALRRTRACPYDTGVPRYGDPGEWLVEGAGNYGMLTVAQMVERLRVKAADSDGNDTTARGGLVVISGTDGQLPAEVLDWAATERAAAFSSGEEQLAIEFARRGQVTTIAVDGRDGYEAVRRFADKHTADRAELAGVLLGGLHIYRVSESQALVGGVRFSRTPVGRRSDEPSYDAAPTIPSVLDNAELLVRRGLATADQVIGAGYRFTNRSVTFLHEVEEHFRAFATDNPES